MLTLGGLTWIRLPIMPNLQKQDVVAHLYSSELAVNLKLTLTDSPFELSEKDLNRLLISMKLSREQKGYNAHNRLLKLQEDIGLLTFRDNEIYHYQFVHSSNEGLYTFNFNSLVDIEADIIAVMKKIFDTSADYEQLKSGGRTLIEISKQIWLPRHTTWSNQASGVNRTFYSETYNAFIMFQLEERSMRTEDTVGFQDYLNARSANYKDLDSFLNIKSKLLQVQNKIIGFEARENSDAIYQNLIFLEGEGIYTVSMYKVKETLEDSLIMNSIFKEVVAHFSSSSDLRKIV